LRKRQFFLILKAREKKKIKKAAGQIKTGQKGHHNGVRVRSAHISAHKRGGLRGESGRTRGGGGKSGNDRAGHTKKKKEKRGAGTPLEWKKKKKKRVKHT